jgi:hypothetical protein
MLTLVFTDLVYLEAFERCTVTSIRRFNQLETLDAEIKRQLSLIKLSSPDKQAHLEEHLDAIVERIRETWIHKYYYKFDDVNGGEASAYPTSSVLEANDHVKLGGLRCDANGNASHTSTVPTERPTATASMPTNHWPLVLPIADGNHLKAPAVPFQHPTEPANIPSSQQPLALHAADGIASTAPAVRVPHLTVTASIPLSLLMALPQVSLPSFRCLQPDQKFRVLPQKLQFSFTGPKLEQQFEIPPQKPQSSSTGRRPKKQPKDEGFIGGNAPFQPLFVEGFDPDLSPDFRRIYPTFDNIHTEPKRVLVRLLLNDMPRETVARCMEALFRGENDLDEAKEWLSRTFETQGNSVIFLSDDDGEDEGQHGAQGKEVGFWEQGEEGRFWEQDEEPDRGRAKKKQKVGSSSAHGLLGEGPSGSTQVPQRRFERFDSATSQMWNKKAVSNLEVNPPHQPFVTANQNLQSSALPDIAVTLSRAALGYGSRHDAAIESALKSSRATNTSIQRPKLPVPTAVPFPQNSTN